MFKFNYMYTDNVLMVYVYFTSFFPLKQTEKHTLTVAVRRVSTEDEHADNEVSMQVS